MTSDKKKTTRILLVDDEYDVSLTVKTVLEKYGFAVDCYNDPTMALSNFKPGLYDLLLLDIKMPGLNGFDLYQKIREIDEKAKICFITASEMFYEEFRTGVIDKYSTLDKEYFIQKPFRIDDLIRQLNEIINCATETIEEPQGEETFKSLSSRQYESQQQCLDDLRSRLVAGVINQEQYETLKARCLEKFQASPPPPDTGSSIGTGNASSSSSP
jgi:DNA-binding response OmpR family regulator